MKFGGDPASTTAGVLLFSLFTYLIEIPIGALGWLTWALWHPALASPGGRPPAEGQLQQIGPRRAGSHSIRRVPAEPRLLPPHEPPGRGHRLSRAGGLVDASPASCRSTCA